MVENNNSTDMKHIENTNSTNKMTMDYFVCTVGIIY